MKKIELNDEKTLVSVGGGVTNGEINTYLKQYGLAHVGGNVGSVGYSGLGSVGGYGSLARLHGLAVDNFVSVEIVNIQKKKKSF